MPNEGLPLRPFGIPDLVWPPGVCAACYEPQWSDALLDWEFVEAVAGPCSACRVRREGPFKWSGVGLGST